MLIGGGALAVIGGSTAYMVASAMGTSSEYSAGMTQLRAPLADPASARDLIR